MPLDVAQAVDAGIASGRYASVSDLVADSVRTLLERNSEVEAWLREEVVAGHAEYLADPSRATPVEDIIGRIQSGYTARDE